MHKACYKRFPNVLDFFFKNLYIGLVLLNTRHFQMNYPSVLMELFFALFLQLIVSYASEQHSIQLKYIRHLYHIRDYLAQNGERRLSLEP